MGKTENQQLFELLELRDNYGRWFPRGDVEVMVSNKPRVVYVRNQKGIVAVPYEVCKNFKSLDQIIEQAGLYLEVNNA